MEAVEASNFLVGDRVSALATIFDDQSGNWSKLTFGSSWNTARCNGTITNINSKKSVKVRWDIDGKKTNIETKLLKLESRDKNKISEWNQF